MCKRCLSENTRASYYKDLSELYLNEEAINAELQRKIEDFIKGLKLDFPEFTHYPAQAKMAIVDMAYNLGVQGLVRKFPTLCRAIQSKNWSLCAQECRRKQISQARNDWTKQQFLSLEG